MKTYSTKIELIQELELLRKSGLTIGFVPTMGALHQGHISLIERALSENDRVICSIFVNPTQFNEASDLENYPRPINEDIRMLEQVGCHILFHPSVDEMYTDTEKWEYDLGELERIFEGSYRNGHFKGVAQIITKLFHIANPDKAYFGQKDYQQFLIIKKIINDFKFHIELVACPIIREADGLAMSSRNRRLNDTERKNAAQIFQTLTYIQSNFNQQSIDKLIREAEQQLKQIPDSELEYIAIVDGENLSLVNEPENHNSILAITAIRIGAIRLIDNINLKG